MNKTFAIDIPGRNGKFLRMGLDRVASDRKRGSGPWFIQFWITTRRNQQTGGHCIFIAPEDVRNGLQNHQYEGRGDRNLPRRLTVQIGPNTTRVQTNYANSDGDAVEVDTIVLNRVLGELFHRLDTN